MPFVCFFETVVSTTQLKFLRHRFPQWDHSLFFFRWALRLLEQQLAKSSLLSLQEPADWEKSNKIHHKNVLLFQACPFPECSQEPIQCHCKRNHGKDFNLQLSGKSFLSKPQQHGLQLLFKIFKDLHVHTVVPRVAPRPASRFFCCLASL